MLDMTFKDYVREMYTLLVSKVNGFPTGEGEV